MASADFLQFVVTTSFFSSSARPPQVSVTTFASYICCIYTLKFGQYWTSFCSGNSSLSSMPSMQFLFVRPRLCRRLPSDSTSRWTPLPLANSSYCQVCSGLSPPSYNACRAHTVEKDSKKVCYPFHFCFAKHTTLRAMYSVLYFMPCFQHDISIYQCNKFIIPNSND